MLDDYFDNLEAFAHASLFDHVQTPWEAVGNIGEYLRRWFEETEIGFEFQSTVSGTTFHKLTKVGGKGSENIMVVQYPVTIQRSIFLKPWKIAIGKGSILESDVIIKSPAIIGENCQIRHGAYLRGKSSWGIIASWAMPPKPRTPFFSTARALDILPMWG